MVGSRGRKCCLKMLTLIRPKAARKRTIIVGLKSDNGSREILLRLLALVVKAGDSVLAVHVQEPYDTFNPNTFHIHEDICKSKQVDFQVKVCQGDSYISELTHQVRLNYATILVLGCGLSGPKETLISTCLKGLPPTCILVVMDNRGRILLQREGTSQQGSTRPVFQSSNSSSPKHSCVNISIPTFQLQKSLPVPSYSTLSPLLSTDTEIIPNNVKKSSMQVSNFMAHKLFDKLALLDHVKESIKVFTSQELIYATNNFNSKMVIGEGEHGKVFEANLDDGQAVAVKVLKMHFSLENLLWEVQMLSDIKHENVIQIVGYCNCKEMKAIVYNLMKGSLRRFLRRLRWNERMGVAIGVAKALNYLHHSRKPPIIHTDVMSSNILLSDDFQPQLSGFGAAIKLKPSQANSKQYDVFGSFGYLGPENMMHENVDEKIDVYSYGVLLLELITGNEDIKTTDQGNQECLVPWARSLLGCGQGDRLIDSYLNDDYNKKEMEIMMSAARLCLLQSSASRPTMKTILKLFHEPDYLLKMQIAEGERGA